MQWHHIRDKRPDDGADIIQIDPPFEGTYIMGMRKYCPRCSWEEFLKQAKEFGWAIPDFWWMYAKDFPFPYNC